MTTATLDAYFDRIGYGGPAVPRLETLRHLHRLHPEAIPFENLDPFLGRPVSLDDDALDAKLVRGGRGGYCYEQNLLFMRMLGDLGFEVEGLAARVIWGRPADRLAPRSHMLLRVEIEGATWIADVGFGGLTLTAPLVLEPDVIQQTPHERWRLLEEAGYFQVQAEVGGDWRGIYRFDLSDHHRADYEVPNYYLSTKPNSHFVTGLVAARALPGRRYALAGNRLSVYERDGAASRLEVGSAAELADVLETMFGLTLPDRAAFEEAIVRKNIVGGAA